MADLTMNTMLIKHGLKVSDSGRGELRARSLCRFVLPRIHFIPDLLTYLVTLFLKRRCDRTLGELAAAMEGQSLITGVLLPPVCGALYQYFLHPPPGTPAWLRWGPGGNYMVGGILYLFASLNLWLLPARDLYVDDE
jgi:hypothetical protein